MTCIYLIVKEFKQMMRNILLPIVFIILPLALTNGVPRLATQEIKGLKFVVIDNDHSTTSQRLINKIDASKYIDLARVAYSYDDAMEAIDNGETDLILEFQPDFERDLVRTGTANIMLSANATNGTKGTMAQSYIAQIINDYNSELMQEKGVNTKVLTAGAKQMASISPRFLFNTKLDYKLYMVPAILGMVLILIVGFLPALNIVSEKEKGTIEQINVTPIKKWEFIVSKIVPYVFVGLFMLLEALMVAKGVFGFWSQGSVLQIFLFAIIFCMLVSSFGLIVSNYSTTLQQAALTMFFFLVIFLLMSGLLTPIQSMPEWAQKITYFNPLRYFVEAMRATYIKGSTLSQLYTQLIVLIVYSCFTWTWAIISYRKNN